MTPSPYRIPARETPARNVRTDVVELDAEWLVLGVGAVAVTGGVLRRSFGVFEGLCALAAWSAAREIITVLRERLRRREPCRDAGEPCTSERRKWISRT